MSEQCGESIDCGKALARVWDYLDGRLEPTEAREFERHLAHCVGCDGARDFEQRLLNAVRRIDPDAPATAELVERVRQALRQCAPPAV